MGKPTRGAVDKKGSRAGGRAAPVAASPRIESAKTGRATGGAAAKPAKPAKPATRAEAGTKDLATPSGKIEAPTQAKVRSKAAPPPAAIPLKPIEIRIGRAAKAVVAGVIKAVVAPSNGKATQPHTPAPAASNGHRNGSGKLKSNGKGGRRTVRDTSTSSIVMTEEYRPSDAEPFMNPRQRLYFRAKLTAWRDDIIRQTRETLQGLHEETLQHADLADRATSETDRALELRARDRQRKLIAKIGSALARIEDGSYGYCEETGEPINLKRLDARPIATLSLEAQERHERRERVFRED